ncbi:MAG: hypothetical protein ACXVCE_15050, partial [Bacteriovorax sp.]
MSRHLQKIMASAVLALVPVASFALPIDWHGSFGVDSTLISDFRRIDAKNVNSTGTGSQEVGLDTGNKASASWQSYVFRLSPTMVINDAATFFGELSSGYANGGYLGDSPQTDRADANNAQLAYHNQAKGQSLNIKKAYLELYSDTATYVIGRHSTEWALGAIYNDGSDAWDRHASSRDGITMKLKIGNFHVSPFWSKISNPGYTDATNTKEYGASLLYDNQERDIAFGILYGKRSNGTYSSVFTTDMNGTPAVNLGDNNITVTDLYLKKVFGKIDFAVEVPLMSGELGRTSTASNATTYSAKAFILQTNYKWTDTWTIGFDGGQVSGHDGSTGKFGALYLNPNYQVANLLFRYNIAALGTSNQAVSVYDSYITNARYFKLRSTYNSEKWTFDTALIYAKALEVARAGFSAYNHTKNKIFTATTAQSDSLGTEIDMNAKYHWNKEITIGSGLGYLLTGDYFSYTNDATKP